MTALVSVSVMPDRVLFLTPSRGLGGGIERYVEALEWAFTDQGVKYGRLDLRGAGAVAHSKLLAEARGQLRAWDTPTRLVLAHRALLPVASLLVRERVVSGMSVLCHGSDVWGMRLRPRWWVENRLMGRDGIRVIAVSSFTAGALFRGRLSSVLPPGLSRCWFDTLVKASGNVRASHPGIQVTTAFRLVDWRNKGLPELMNAIGALDRSDVHLTVCGSGDPPPDLRRHMQQREYCSLRPGLSDGELAAQLADSDLFVLATRTRHGRRPSGEGFGMVLLEAQVAGTPVVAPAYGGARDAYLDQVTGASPTDESEEALVSTLARLLRDPDRLARMGRRAAEWTSEAFAPDNYAPLAVARLL